MKLSKLMLYGLLTLIIGTYNQCAPEDWTYKSKEYVVRKDLSSKIPLASASTNTQVLSITPKQIDAALGLQEQLDSEWFGEKMTKTLKSVKVESCSVDINILPDNQATIMYLEGTLTVIGKNTPLFNESKPIPMSDLVLYPLTEALNKNAVADVEKAINDNLQNLDKTLTLTYKITPSPANRVARAEVDMHLVVTAIYDVCQLMPPGSGGKNCK
ncbi:hypothetical protein [Spirosoma gilvum]